MATEYWKRLRELQELTKTNLAKEMENVHDFGEEAIHFADRCDAHLALKSMTFSEMAAAQLRRQAEQRYVNGAITKEEHSDILDRSLELIHEELTMEVANRLMVSCDCHKW